jgi:hypothetical protein
MHYFIYTLFVLFLSSSISHAQINNRIKENSDKNAENRNRRNNSNNDSDDTIFGDDEYEAEWSDAADLTCELCCGSGFLIFGLIDLNDRIKAKEPEISRINSVDLSFSFGHITQNSKSYMPRLEINGSLLSTSLRVFTNSEEHIEGRDTYTTIDWQMLMLNLVVEQEVNFRIGSGIMFEEYSGLLFNEHTASFDIYFGDRFKWNLEGRYTPDYKTKITVRKEFNTSVHYLFHQKNETLFSGFVKFLAANYYDDVKFSAFYFGVEINFGY